MSGLELAGKRLWRLEVERGNHFWKRVQMERKLLKMLEVLFGCLEIVDLKQGLEIKQVASSSRRNSSYLLAVLPKKAHSEKIGLSSTCCCLFGFASSPLL